MAGTDCRMGLLIETACLLEARARKPGNVHPEASFVDMRYDDFVRSGRCIAPVFDRAERLTVGQLVLESVVATKEQLGRNTSLGIILVLVPLAKAKAAAAEAVSEVLNALTQEDARLVYEAIRLARPGGLGDAEEQDVRQTPTVTLLEAMRLAASRDLIARQYATGFCDTFTLLLPTLERGMATGVPLEQVIVHTYLESLATLGDTLILRKCGPAIAEEARQRACQVLQQGWPATAAGVTALRDFDRWLRADGHRRNPGTTADLIAGALFLALRRGSIEIPVSRPWECPAL